MNSWGRDLAPEIRTEFGELLRACDAVDGIERIRFTSPHPKDFREPVIAAMAECAAVCEHVHLPLQSGSSRLLKAMRRTYDLERYLGLVERLRAAIPDLALGTDIIVGFPGETEDDFAQTLAAVEEVRFDSAFTFIFSPRSGTEAAELPDQLPYEVKRERLERLVEVVQRIAAERNVERIGGLEEVLVEGTEPNRRVAAARSHAAQHDRELRRRRRAWRAGAGRDRKRHVHDARRAAVRARRRLTHTRHRSAPDTRELRD